MLVLIKLVFINSIGSEIYKLVFLLLLFVLKVAGAALVYEVQRNARGEAKKEEKRQQELAVSSSIHTYNYVSNCISLGFSTYLAYKLLNGLSFSVLIFAYQEFRRKHEKMENEIEEMKQRCCLLHEELSKPVNKELSKPLNAEVSKPTGLAWLFNYMCCQSAAAEKVQ